jgi:dihydrofolate reductase
VVEEALANTRATVMGRRMFSGGEGPWDDDPNADAWWGDDPPFHHPVFVVTHHAREPVTKQGGTTFTFVTDGIEAALEQARDRGWQQGRRGGRRSQRGAAVPEGRAARRAAIHVVPVLLGDGVRLLEGDLAEAPGELEHTRVLESPTGVTHLKDRVVK